MQLVILHGLLHSNCRLQGKYTALCARAQKKTVLAKGKCGPMPLFFGDPGPVVLNKVLIAHIARKPAVKAGIANFTGLKESCTRRMKALQELGQSQTSSALRGAGPTCQFQLVV